MELVLHTKEHPMKTLIVIALLLLTSIASASNMRLRCAGSNGWDGSSFRVELRYMDSEHPEYISYVNGDLWAHWYMDKQSPLMKKSKYFKWYNGSAEIVSYSYETKVLKLISIDGEYPNITEIQCKDK
jgi:hypothetical protein